MTTVFEHRADDGPEDSLQVLLLEYACGALDAAATLMVESWLCLSAEARAAVARYETVGGAMMCQGCPPERMKEDSLRNVLDRLDCQNRAAARARAAAEQAEERAAKTALMAHFADLPPPLRQCVTGHPAWRSFRRGLEMTELEITDCAHAMLFRSAPGASQLYPESGMTLVIEGAMSDGLHYYGPGALLLLEPARHGRYTADSRKGCLSFVISDEAPGRAGGLTGFIRSLLGR